MREKASKRMKNNHKYFGSNFVEREKFAKSVGEIKKSKLKADQFSDCRDLGRDDLVGMRMQYLKICVVTKMKT
jgi:hypothetical protein